jgi:hypothetical protein
LTTGGRSAVAAPLCRGAAAERRGYSAVSGNQPDKHGLIGYQIQNQENHLLIMMLK